MVGLKNSVVSSLEPETVKSVDTLGGDHHAVAGVGNSRGRGEALTTNRHSPWRGNGLTH